MKRKIAKLFTCIIAIITICMTPMTANALEGDDYTVPDQGKGTIRLSLVFEDDVDHERVQTPVRNVEFSLYQVWTYTDGLVTFTDAFKDAGVELDGTMSAKDVRDTAPRFSAIKENAPVYKTAVSDADGNVAFTGLPFGGYLVAPKGEVVQDAVEYTTGDFLVTLPYKVDATGEWLADFTVGPQDPELHTDAVIAPKFILTKTDLPLVRIRKIAVDTKSDLKGATLAIKDQAGREFIRDASGKDLIWKTDGTAKEVNLDPGSYTLTEIEAPKGYGLADDIRFVVNEDYTLNLLDDAGNPAEQVDEIVMEDVRDDSRKEPPNPPDEGKKNPPETGKTNPPKTGDIMNMLPYIGLLCGALVILVLAARRRKTDR